MIKRYIMLGIVFCVKLHADESLQKKEPIAEPARISIIAVGSKPMRKYGYPNDDNRKKMQEFLEKEEMQAPARMKAPILLKPSEYETPVSRVFFKISEQEEWNSLNIGFNNQGAMREVPSGHSIDLYKQRNDAEDAKPYLTLPKLNSKIEYLLVLSPQASGKNSWRKKPHMSWLILPKLTENVPSAVFINTTRQKVILSRAGKDAVQLNPFEKTWMHLPQDTNKETFVVDMKSLVEPHASARVVFRPSLRVLKVYVLYDEQSPVRKGSLGVFRATYSLD